MIPMTRRPSSSRSTETALTKRGFDELLWELCYSHYLYPAFLVAWSSRVVESLPIKPTTVDALASRNDLPADGLLALLPTFILFQMVRQSPNLKIVRTSPRLRPNYSKWMPMFRRHIQRDPHVKRNMRLFQQRKSRNSRGFWRKQLAGEAMMQLFLASVDAHSKSTAPIIAEKLSRAGITKLTDLGAGLGTNSFAALQRSPQLRATLIDQKPVVHAIRATQEFARFEERILLHPMNALTTKWPRCDGVVLLAHFLQDFGRKDRARLLRRARAAIQPGGELWIHGHFWRVDSVSPTVAAFSFYLYCSLGGAILSVNQQIAECREAGFRLTEEVRTSVTQSLFLFSCDES
jgi:hypothetical protein